jgi:hypothetical protein
MTKYQGRGGLPWSWDNNDKGQMWWFMSAIPTTGKEEIVRITV